MIDLVGIEIEGKWDEEPPCGEIVHDGSVYVNGTNSRCDRHPGPATNSIGEVVSPPIETNQVETWMRSNYPDWVNRTCGIHVHMSMDHKKYQYLMDSQWYEYFKLEMGAWGESNEDRLPDTFFNRFNGSTDWARRYCRDRFEPDAQLKGRGPGRYTMLNYQAFRAHGTIECRFLPAFGSSLRAIPNDDSTRGDPDIAVEAVHALLRIVEQYLEAGNKQDVFAFSVHSKSRDPETIER